MPKNMKPIELVMGADRQAWGLPASHGTESDRNIDMRNLRLRVLARDDNVCAGCTWRSRSYQEIHPRNGNHRDMHEDNWATLCPLCHQVFHLPIASSSGGGELIWLPEISQADLNLLSIVLFIARRNQDHPWYTLAGMVNADLANRVAFIRARFNRQDPSLLAQILVRMKPEEYATRAHTLRHLRLLPRPERFTTAINAWAKDEFSTFPPDAWEKVLSQAMQAKLAALPKTDVSPRA